MSEIDYNDDLIYHEMISQPYANCKFSAGFVTGHPIDTLYLKIERDNDDEFIIVLRPDEMAAISYCASGILWSHLNDIQEKKSEATNE